MKKRTLILAVLAVVLVLSASIGSAVAYFTTYATARGGYVTGPSPMRTSANIPSSSV